MKGVASGLAWQTLVEGGGGGGLAVLPPGMEEATGDNQRCSPAANGRGGSCAPLYATLHCHRHARPLLTCMQDQGQSHASATVHPMDSSPPCPQPIESCPSTCPSMVAGLELESGCQEAEGWGKVQCGPSAAAWVSNCFSSFSSSPWFPGCCLGQQEQQQEL